MSNTIRINTTPNGSDKYLKVKLDQDFDFIEILSLRLSQEDAYTKFCSDYGTIVGRVIINSGFGVPNAKVSVFIPIDDVDKNDPLIKGLYPYEVITDKDSDGIRYNLFPKESETNNDCFTPIGTFPTKREVLDNETILGIYCKYYKFTTTTNYAGDFMIFGVPLGTYTVHVDADISDIGEASQRPYDLIRQGTPAKLFDSSTKFKGGTNLDKLVQVKTANVGVNVQPFWGDTENCEVGITRVDIDLNYTLVPAAIFMGSIFGDQDKHSINKRCRPRKALGEMCEQVTSSGSIDIIRKDLDNQIEDFSVDGGRVIDDDGTWAFQIPMNLDYMVTAEDGSMILSQDPNIGIPTRANVRFKISMDETGGEGRLRTRASYLVPNNPQTQNEIDYEFGTKTKDSSFKDLYWNKIYSVSNFITRFGHDKTNGSPSRNMTAIKDVDACAGDKTPFPYNRIMTETNPIFFIICLIIKIIGFIVWLINKTVIKLINKIILLVNRIIDFINDLGGNFELLQYVPCITVQCETDEGTVYYAPGCSSDDEGYSTANPQPTRYCGDSLGHTCRFGDDVGWTDCIAFELAKALNLFQFDFYNDWINGTLFSYLLKYKKRRKGKEKFCEYDCSDFTSDPNYSGVDGNNNGISDNNCYNHMFVDTLFDNSTHEDCQKEYKIYRTFRDGLIKKYDDTLYYASTLHDASKKLFATDIICLGSVFDCDWQGLPKIQQYLIPTSYKLPPDVAEVSETISGTDIINATGMVYEGGTVLGNFFSVNCLGLHVDGTQAMNIRHICELGVDLDELLEDPITGVVIQPADGIIGSNDINGDLNEEIRNVFLALNRNSIFPTIPLNIAGLSSNFNINNSLGFYDFAQSTTYNGIDYINFRGIPTSSNYAQSKHSFYFYFGALPGKTSLDKMNERYFTPCVALTRGDMIIESTETPSTSTPSNGSIVFNVIGGHGPYTYTVTSSNGYTVGPTIVNEDPANINQSLPVTLSPLATGSYTITIVDDTGNQVTQTVFISGPPPFYCSVNVSQNATTLGVDDGQISINAGGGGSTLNFTVTDSFGAPAGVPSSGILTTNPQIINGLAVNTTLGYTVTVTDGVSACTTTGLTVSGPSYLNVSETHTDVTCYNGQDGTMDITINGGTPPYTITTTGPSSFTSNSLHLTNLKNGVYITTVIDSLSTTTTLTTTLTALNPPLTISIPTSAQLAKQCDPSNYNVPIYISAPTGLVTAYIAYMIDGGSWQYTSAPYVSASIPIILTIPSSLMNTNIKIKFSNTSTHTCYSNVVTYTTTQMALPLLTLAITPDTIYNQKQCVTTAVNVGFRLNSVNRAPYTVTYTVNGASRPSFTTSPSTTLTPVTFTTPPSGSGPQTIAITVTDNVGCTASSTFVITLPTSSLNFNINTTGSGTYTHNVSTPTGGIGAVTFTPFGVGTVTNSSPTLTTTATDSVGCSVTKTG